MQGRIEHEDWTCPICAARNTSCLECSGLGTADAYYKTQELAEAAMKDEDGVAAQVLERIAWWPDGTRDRAFWVSRMIDGALRQIGAN